MDLSRRQALTATGATVLGATGIVINSRQASGSSVELDTLNVEDVAHNTDGEEIESIDLTVDARYEYETNRSVDRFEIDLLIGDASSTLMVIDTVEKEDIGQSGDGVETLSNSLTSTYHYSTESFEPNGDTTRNTTVWVGLEFRLYSGDEVVESAKLTDTATVSVDGSELEVSVSLGGVGSIDVE